ncbi:hypothetical protein TWF225_007923 [Orbilia oligospora]|uniref:Uncharacterized protein n=1 Tax=Orbilia oligospora TaxID=2813651 RepID=A0A7C8PJ50_ORBOL|nr:hypothetical protein TWF751_007995 [Orbilia oligospora]KAF3178624.1 hypothetical protein TWF225_007923 [Orbilia oligospora]KAF3260236.1 hypothetical protein TWF128_003696 [Orbilia oligospora]KAF3272525.1 hypothetical protein TWF217_000018 [Orbilia oligospora]KAF3292032.1 hypothetical protein TWF132_006276 [Orbilia oligospora]
MKKTVEKSPFLTTSLFFPFFFLLLLLLSQLQFDSRTRRRTKVRKPKENPGRSLILTSQLGPGPGLYFAVHFHKKENE